MTDNSVGPDYCERCLKTWTLCACPPNDTDPPIHPAFDFERWWAERSQLLATQHPNFHEVAEAAYAAGFHAGKK